MNILNTIPQNAVRLALDEVLEQLTSLTIAVTNLKATLCPDQTEQPDEFDPRDLANKGDGGKLTPRGIEICYRLFDRGANRNKVAILMDISFTAATHRYQVWQKIGGLQRERLSLD